MHFLQVILVGAAGCWGQPPPVSLPETNPDMTPYQRSVDTVHPNDPVSAIQPIPFQEETVVDWEAAGHRQMGAEIWGLLFAKAYYVGDRMAPNGVTFEPIFALGN